MIIIKTRVCLVWVTVVVRAAADTKLVLAVVVLHPSLLGSGLFLLPLEALGLPPLDPVLPLPLDFSLVLGGQLDVIGAPVILVFFPIADSNMLVDTVVVLEGTFAHGTLDIPGGQPHDGVDGLAGGVVLGFLQEAEVDGEMAKAIVVVRRHW
jgi:hypothetical protein